MQHLIGLQLVDRRPLHLAADPDGLAHQWHEQGIPLSEAQVGGAVAVHEKVVEIDV